MRFPVYPKRCQMQWRCWSPGVATQSSVGCSVSTARTQGRRDQWRDRFSVHVPVRGLRLETNKKGKQTTQSRHRRAQEQESRQKTQNDECIPWDSAGASMRERNMRLYSTWERTYERRENMRVQSAKANIREHSRQTSSVTRFKSKCRSSESLERINGR